MKSASVVGSGIIGLTSVLALKEKGFKVKIISKEPYSQTLSHKVGAIWFPFEIRPVEKAATWGARTYERYIEEAKRKSGVSFIPFMVAYDEESNNEWTKQMPEGTLRQATSAELPNGVSTAFVAKVPLAEPPLYLPYLIRQCEQTDIELAYATIKSLEEMSQLDEVVINATGLGAKSLCKDDSLRPMRGQILRCKPLNITSCVNSTKPGKLTYVIKRSEDCIIGGTDYLDDWNREVMPDDTQLILQRLNETGLSPNPPQIIEELVGLRPSRSSVRFEFDPTYPNIFHNYGHGGAGFTVCWGCALEIADKLSET